MSKPGLWGAHARVWAIALLVTMFLAGCKVGPDYRRPDVSTPDRWRFGVNEVSEISNVVWWNQFHDPVLSTLVLSALQNNLDLQIAAANVDRAAAQYGIVRSARFPQVSAGASAGRERRSQTSALALPPGRQVFNDYSVGLSASFELDVWGKLRRASESARASLLASEEGRRTVVLTVVSLAANGYIQLRALDRQLEIARHTSETLGEAARLQQVRFNEGAVPESDYRQAEAQYEAAAAQVPELERQIARQENFIRALLGMNPGPVQRGATIDELTFPDIPAVLPASLLERRPDIVQAEKNLIAANANIGVAKAAYFPEINLTAALGLRSAQLSDLFKSPSSAWSYGGNLTQPIFNAGLIRNQVAQAEAIQRQALVTYQKSIISAFQDVEDAFVDRTKFSEAAVEQARNVTALQRFRDIAALRYKEGATIYLELSSAEQALFNAQLSLVSLRAQLFQSYANLYKSMGGGWVLDADRLASDQRPSEYK